MARILILLLGVLLIVSLVSCAAPDENEAIPIGIITPLGRNWATANGAILAAEVINAGGGVMVKGQLRPIRIIVEDCERRPEAAVSKALELINRQGVVAIVGVPLSLNAIPVAEVAERARIPFITTQSTHPQTTAGKSFTFRLTMLDTAQGRAMASFAYHDLGVRRAAVIADESSPYSSGLAEIFANAFRELGGRVEAMASFTADRPRFPDLARLEALAPEAIYLPIAYEILAPFLADARAGGLRSLFLGGDSWSRMLDYPDEAGGSYFTDVWSPERGGPRVAAFIAEHRRFHGTEPLSSSALAYDGLMLLAEAIRLSGSLEPQAIRDALSTIHFEGISGTLRFTGSGDPQRPVLIRRMNPGGEISFVREFEADHFLPSKRTTP